MNLYLIKWLLFTKNNNIKIKREIDRKIIFNLIAMAAVLKSLQLLLKKN